MFRRSQANNLSKLAGIDDEAVSRDYALTRVGREPAREMIMARLTKEPLFASNNDAALNMFTCRYGHDRNRFTRFESHGLLLAMEPCGRFSSISRRSTVVQKNIYEAIRASPTKKFQLSRDISLSLRHCAYNLTSGYHILSHLLFGGYLRLRCMYVVWCKSRY